MNIVKDKAGQDSVGAASRANFSAPIGAFLLQK